MGRNDGGRAKGRGGRAGAQTQAQPATREAASPGAKGAVIVVGGSGGLTGRYREVVEERGHELRHFEKRVPSGTRRILGRVAAVIVMVGMVSHALRDQAKALVEDDAPVVYLRSASVSALRGAIAELDAGEGRPA